MKMLKGKKGFTLVELIIVIVIIAILAAIAVPALARYMRNANEGRAVANARAVFMALSADIADQIAKEGTNRAISGTPDTDYINDITDLSGVNLRNPNPSSGNPKFTAQVNTAGSVTDFVFYDRNAVEVERTSENEFRVR